MYCKVYKRHFSPSYQYKSSLGYGSRDKSATLLCDKSLFYQEIVQRAIRLTIFCLIGFEEKTSVRDNNMVFEWNQSMSDTSPGDFKRAGRRVSGT